MKLHINGAALHVLDSSVAEPQSSICLLFLHYFGGSARSWGEVTARLPEFRCIAPDLRGFGASQATPGGYAVNDSADDIAALIESLQLERFVLVGHSMGGKIALALAARQPAGLERLILLAPSPPSPEPMDATERKRLLDGCGERSAAEATLRSIAARPLPQELHLQAVEDAVRSSPQAWRAWLEAGSREDISSRMSRVRVPVCVAAGECDRAMTPALLQREIVARIDGSTLTTLPGTAHLLPLEAPEKVAALIRREGSPGRFG